MYFRLMTPENFCYWLQGFFELQGAVINPELSAPQVNMIKKHLDLAMTPVTRPPSTPDSGVQTRLFC